MTADESLILRIATNQFFKNAKQLDKKIGKRCELAFHNRENPND